MTSLGIVLRRTRGGWSVDLTDGRRIARFYGLGAARRAQRYAASPWITAGGRPS